MGSTFSVQTKEKRRRSNRLSKPPQNQSAPGCSSSRSLHQSGEQALSPPSTPTAWQNTWTDVPVSVGSNDFVSHYLRSQSFSAKPLRRETTWKSNSSPVAQRSIHSTADIWPQPPTSPTRAPSRRSSLYGRASFHPSEVATFQPTTLQSIPQPPLIGQPKRSYSVHSPSQKTRTAVQQRRTLDRFASFNSHTRVKCQEALPIRRRSLLVRPGVATRKALEDFTPSSFPESYHDGIVSHDPNNPKLEPAQPPWSTRQGVLPSDVNPFSHLRPATPSDLGYTHLGALKLGSLRVVNGTASPCPSNRTLLDYAESLSSEATPDDVDATDLLDAGETTDHLSRSISSDGLEMYAQYHPILDTPGGLDHALTDLSSESETLYLEAPASLAPSARNGMPTTLSNTCVAVGRDDVDFPASPFSFEKSPTSISTHGLERYGAEDEGISVHCSESALVSLPCKVPERYRSHSGCASSHRRGDSGYSSATSHRNSIDSHVSLWRSSGFRKLTVGDNYRKLELRDLTMTAITGIQPSANRHLSLQDYRSCSRQLLRNRPTSIPRVKRDQPQIIAKGRPRGSSLPVPRTSDCPFSLPLQITQQGNTSFAMAGLPGLHFAPTPHTEPYGMGLGDEALCSNCSLGGSSCPYSAISSSTCCDFHDDFRERADSSDNTTAIFPNHPALRNQVPFIKSHRAEPKECQTRAATVPYRRYSSAVKSDHLLPLPDNAFPPRSIADQASNEFAVEPPRGRTRSRSIGYHYRRPSEQKPANLTAVYT